MSLRWVRILLVAACISCHACAATQAFNGASLIEEVGRRVPDDLAVTDEDGHATTLARLRGSGPLLLVPAYYHCPMLCGLVVDGLARSLHALKWAPGRRFRIATISFDPQDTPQDAARGQATALAAVADPAQWKPSDWPFCVASASEAERFLQAIGMTVSVDPSTRQISHPAAVVVVTADGRISRYLCGISFPVRDLRLALLDAGADRTASVSDEALLFCYHYDPASHRYGFAVQRLLRAVSIGVSLAIAIILTWAIRRRRAPRRPGMAA